MSDETQSTRTPPPSQGDGLFLLEVLIDKVVFTKAPCFEDRSFRTCVAISAPAVPTFEICDDDPDVTIARSATTFTKSFNSGKSCLFSLKESVISSAISNFAVQVQVYKSLPCGCIPTKIILGKASINMTKEFVEARQRFLKDPTSISYQALKDTFQIVGEDDKKSGDITMFLRISCFGKLIVTKFQGVGGPPTLGTGVSEGLVDRTCNPRKTMQTPDDPCACGSSWGHGGKVGDKLGPCPRCGGQAVCPTAVDPYNSMPCAEPDEPCYCCGAIPKTKERMLCRNTDQYCLHVPKGRSTQYEEIGTKVNGNELKIRVPTSASIIKKLSQTHCTLHHPYVKTEKNLPPDSKKAKALEGPCIPPCGRNQIALVLPSEDVCCRGALPQSTQFTCTTEGCSQAKPHGQEPMQYDPPTNKNCFLFKVAKTAIQGDRKCKMELELVTPKGPDKRLPTQKANACQQAESECLCCTKRIKKHKPPHCPDCCPPGNKVVFQMPTETCGATGTGHKQRTHFAMTDGIGKMSREEPGKLVAPSSQDYKGVVFDFDASRVIRMRVGKTVEMAGRTSKMEYVFVTPGMGVEVPGSRVPTRQSQPAQWSPQCATACRCREPPFKKLSYRKTR